MSDEGFIYFFGWSVRIFFGHVFTHRINKCHATAVTPVMTHKFLDLPPSTTMIRRDEDRNRDEPTTMEGRTVFIGNGYRLEMRHVSSLRYVFFSFFFFSTPNIYLHLQMEPTGPKRIDNDENRPKRRVWRRLGQQPQMHMRGRARDRRVSSSCR